MNHRLLGVLSICAAIALPGCLGSGPSDPGLRATLASTAAVREEHSLFTHILLYVPNRVLDLFDIARAGVEGGPGIGIHAQVTELAQLGLLTRISGGAGLQTLRHSPLKLSADTYLGIGPLEADAGEPLPWYRDYWDVLLDVHLLLIGAHVAVNPAEIADLVLGLVGIDIRDDDL